MVICNNCARLPTQRTGWPSAEVHILFGAAWLVTFLPLGQQLERARRDRSESHPQKII
ncbi:hypothetical protein DPMN_010142 [Dreissena polymorpha]|uniref:Uncharacterized protein n=1 Tax=Dreissena polymorpha TaxID=45954 RepID=A0A9D4RYX1_DREPO|nr:hypothetical protein DPMN_010142 [Dreissena polymorpha]